jgi:HAMP domain-containing protein
MGIRLKFNIVLIAVFLAGLALAAWTSHELLQRNAKDEILRNGFAVFAVLFIALNLMLNWMIVRPIMTMARSADSVSTGDFAIPEFSERGTKEIATLGAAFNRMRRSLEKAMQMIES